MAKIGRPTVMAVEERRDAIFAAAEKLFGERGFKAVSMSEIAASVGMSKKTLYEVFKTKADLLRALIGSSYAWTGVDFFKSANTRSEELQLRLREMARHILSIRHVRLCRLAIAEGGRNKQLARSFHEIGIKRSRASLVDSIAKMKPDSHLMTGIPDEMVADMLVGATCFVPFMAALLNQATPDLTSINSKIDRLVENLFEDR
jgi:TetR/AcrR family transcriptional regulator, mexJK operon transcriptional repressor